MILKGIRQQSGSMSSAVASSPPRRVLVVEDDPVFQDSIAEAIGQLETLYRLHAFRTGSAALAWCRRPGIGAGLAFALIDLGLPDCDGIEVIEAVHARFEAVPIMVISVVSSETQVLRAIGAGAVGYILKGDSSLSMTRAIEQIMAGNYPISPKLARCLFRLARRTQTPGGQPGGLPELTPKEMTLLEHLAKGNSYGQAADEMGVKLSTVQTHIRTLYRKLNVHSQTQAVSRARERGLL
jgi:two-component system, NarL family, nitrate/nitrite response regulator NarL